MSAQIDSYTFQFADEGGVQQRVFLPLLALLNHNGDPNTVVTEDKGSDSYVATALRGIRCGAPPLSTLGWEILERCWPGKPSSTRSMQAWCIWPCMVWSTPAVITATHACCRHLVATCVDRRPFHATHTARQQDERFHCVSGTAADG